MCLCRLVCFFVGFLVLSGGFVGFVCFLDCVGCWFFGFFGDLLVWCVVLIGGLFWLVVVGWVLVICFFVLFFGCEVCWSCCFF